MMNTLRKLFTATWQPAALGGALSLDLRLEDLMVDLNYGRGPRSVVFRQRVPSKAEVLS
jgi:hypothetical protein